MKAIAVCFLTVVILCLSCANEPPQVIPEDWSTSMDETTARIIASMSDRDIKLIRETGGVIPYVDNLEKVGRNGFTRIVRVGVLLKAFNIDVNDFEMLCIRYPYLRYTVNFANGDLLVIGYSEPIPPPHLIKASDLVLAMYIVHDNE